jgi:sugar phosphate isomerase/epimerase
MRLACPGAPDLTYCTNIHPGETLSEVRAALATFVPAVKARVCPEAPFAVGLRLSARAATELLAPGEVERFRALLEEHALHVPTINGFPHGAFHGVAVKEAVYQPDWRDRARLDYSNNLADILAALLPEGGPRTGSISTVPGAFRPLVKGPLDVKHMAGNLLAHAAHLHALRERTGKTITLALEPEPFCHLETAAEAVAFFEEHLFTSAATRFFAGLAGVSPAVAEAAIRRHLGVCYDACHGAVLHEDPVAALGAFRRAGIGVGKLQISAGLEIDFAAAGEGESARRALLDALRPFAEGVYLHQVVTREGHASEAPARDAGVTGKRQREDPPRGGALAMITGARSEGGLLRILDLPEAIAAAEGDLGGLGVWRVHFHVPVFAEVLGPFRSTQPFLRELLAVVKGQAITETLEVETYTWDVLPPEHRMHDVDQAIAREIAWVRERLSP